MELAAIYGRERELDLGDGFLRSVGDGIKLLRLEGEAGIGKTTVWRELARRAEQLGFRVLSCQPAETEAKLALSALADLLDAVPSKAFVPLPLPQRRALEIALLRSEPDPVAPDFRTLATAVRSVLAHMSVAGPLLVAIDDVQWLDPTSTMVLAFALRRLAQSSLAVLFAIRGSGAAGLADDGLVPPGSVTRLALGPLTPAALGPLLADRVLPRLSRPALVRIHAAAGGNPLFALEIAREFDELPAVGPGARLPVPSGVRELLADRVPRLPAEASEALLAAAALSRPTVRLVEQASSASGLSAAEESGLVRVDGNRIAFAHPLYASAVYESASRARRRIVHRRLAHLVSDPEEQARHLAAAATGPDERIARALERGAAVARLRGAWESAAELLERAYELTPADGIDEAWRRRIAAAEHHVHAGDRTRARQLLERILGQRLSRPLRADALRLLAEISFNDENSADTLRLFTEALSYADEPRLKATIELGLGYLSGQVADPVGGLGHAGRALVLARAIGDRPLIGAALGLCATFEYLCGRGVRWEKVEQALALEDTDGLMPVLWRPSTIAGILALYVGRHSEARERLTAVLTAARERGDESDVGFILLWLGWLETRSANFAAAAALADEAVSVATLTGSESTRAIVLAQRALVQANLGEVAPTRRDCAEARPLLKRTGAAWVTVWITAALALLEISLGNPAAAWDACKAATERLEEDGVTEPVPAFFLPDAVEALVATGRLDRSQRLLDDFERRGQALDRVWAIATGARCRAVLLAAQGDIAGAQAAVGRALVAHQRLEMPLELARTLLVEGILERRVRRRGLAKQSFGRALEIFERVGARLWAERTRQELGRLGLRRSSPGELTANERRVAELAAQGLTNRQVATELFLSPKTVEANLSRVYRKLGIRSRAELGARVAELLQE